jgi:hypothetical protein
MLPDSTWNQDPGHDSEGVELDLLAQIVDFHQEFSQVKCIDPKISKKFSIILHFELSLRGDHGFKDQENNVEDLKETFPAISDDNVKLESFFAVVVPLFKLLGVEEIFHQG